MRFSTYTAVRAVTVTTASDLFDGPDLVRPAGTTLNIAAGDKVLLEDAEAEPLALAGELVAGTLLPTEATSSAAPVEETPAPQEVPQ